MALVMYMYMNLLISSSVLFWRVPGQTDLCRFGDPNAGCAFPCLCTSGCHRTTGDCVNGGVCQWDDPPEASIRRSGPGCRIGNVARDKPAYQRGQWQSSHAGLAVDGVITSDITQCSHPVARSGQRAWWYVDLQENYTVVSVTIYNREGSPANERTGNFRLGVGDVTDGDRTRLCKDYTRFVPAGGHDTIQCNTPVTGRYVTIIRTGGFEPQFLGLCEVMVHGYTPIECDISRCQSCDTLIGCDKCTPGYKYPECKIECGNEEYGDNCGKQCSENCIRTQGAIDRTCSSSNGHCINKCKRGFWGARCRKACGDNCQDIGASDICSQNDGRCTQNCTDQYYGDQCQLLCNNQCETRDKTQTCERDSGVCRHGCQLIPYDTWYGGNHCNQSIPYVDFRQSDTVNATNVRSDSITIEWSNVEDIPFNTSAIFGYRISTFEETGKNITSLQIQVNTFNVYAKYSQIVTGLSANTTYRIVVNIYRQVSNGKSEDSRNAMEVFVTTLVEEDREFTTSPGNQVGLLGSIVGTVVFLVLAVLIAALVLFIIRRKRLMKSRAEDTAVFVDMPTHSSVKKPKQRTESHIEQEMDHPNLEGHFNENDTDQLYSNIPDTNKLGEGTYIKVEDLEKYIRTKRHEEDGFKKEYNDIPKGELKSCNVAKREEHIDKNRFKNIKAYDCTRVALKTEGDENTSDYINASFITGYPNKKHHYVATQGPKPKTTYALWSMIWQLKSNRIVMATRIKELNKVKCEQYWPETVGEVKPYGDITVTTTACESYADFNLITINLQKGGEKRRVRHLQFLSWPDQQAPDHAFDLVAFRRKLRSFDQEGTGPIVVHCSAGIGRTGTFIALDYLLDQMKVEGKVDVFKIVNQLRQERMNMVQNLAQYVFLYESLLESYQQGETAIPCSVYPERYKQLVDGNEYCNEVPIEDQFQILSKLKTRKRTNAKLSALSKENSWKNRNADIIPDNRHRLFLSTTCPETNDYVNAVMINSFLAERIFIVTQMPLPDTVVDFWRLVYEQDCGTVVTLETPDSDAKDCPMYWSLDKSDTRTFGNLEVRMDLVEEDEKGFSEERRFTLSYASTFHDKAVRVRHILFKQWPDNQTLPGMEDTLNLLERLQKWQHQREDGKIIIQCKDGARRSGLICAAHYMLEKMKADSEVDVFLAVRAVALNRPQFVNDLDQYRFLHDIALEYITRNELYGNFE